MIDQKNYWFKAKLYGWGWYPSTWQGWLVIIVFLIFIASEVMNLQKGEIMPAYLFKITLATIILILICYLTGEKPRWRWGK